MSDQVNSQPVSQQRPVLVIDGLNLFVRAYFSYPQMSSVTGQATGGIVGFMKKLTQLGSEISPSQILVAWEGGGSTRRRGLFKEYKQNRAPPGGPNRFYGSDLPDSDENKIQQVAILVKLLSCLPVCQLYTPDCEGDDVIAYLCRGRYQQHQKVIVSSDKDMFQLIDDRTNVYSLHKKTYVTPETVLEDFRVTTANFALAKALCGDPSDNIPGIKGLGFKTVSKRFPFLGTESDILLSDLFDFCAAHASESVIYRRVLEERETVERNWALVYLSTASLSAEQAARIDHGLDTFKPHVDRMALIRRLITEGVNDIDIDALVYSLIGITGPNNQHS